MRLFNDFIFIVPARKGSKGIKNKNIIKIKNKYLVEYTFKILKKVPKNRKYIISDSDKIKKIAEKYKFSTNYLRSNKLSKDDTTITENLSHFDKFIDKNIKFKHYVILQPTSPLRNYKDLLNSIKKYLKDKSESLFSVSLSLEHPNEVIFLKKKKIYFFNKSKNTLRQNYKKSYFVNGAIYIFNRKLLKYKKIVSKKKHSIFEMPKKRSIDLNDYQDYEITKKLL
jgi:CMP-N,N'-diacetyllegionaminic acid synthase